MLHWRWDRFRISRNGVLIDQQVVILLELQWRSGSPFHSLAMVERLERLCFLVSHPTEIGGAVIPTDSTWLLVGGFHAKGQRFTHFLLLAITFSRAQIDLQSCYFSFSGELVSRSLVEGLPPLCAAEAGSAQVIVQSFNSFIGRHGVLR